MSRFNTSKYEPAVCPRCKKSFSCTGEANCWCFEIYIPEKVNEYMECNFENCLCPNCINELKKAIT